MKVHRFIGKFNLHQPILEIEEPELINQMFRVLELRKGEQIILSDGKGHESTGVILELNKKRARIKTGDLKQNKDEQGTEVILYCAVLKKENFENVVQKATELGVNKIVPLITRRTVKLGLRQDRLKKIIVEAAEQSGRTKVPELSSVIDFEAALVSAKENETNYFFDKGGMEFGQHNLLYRRVGLFIGPEGGWDPSEIAAAEENGIPRIKLSDFVLRGETAAMVSVYLARANLL